MSQKPGKFFPSNSDLISAISSLTNMDGQQKQQEQVQQEQQQQQSQQSSSMSLLNLNFGDCSNLMNLNGYLLPNNSASSNSGSNSDFLYGSGESETTSKSSPLQSIYEISSPEKTNAHGSQNAFKISPSLFEDEDNLEEDDEDKHVTKLFVGNLPTSTTLQELLAVFKKFGPVNEKLSVVKDHNYAFIHFYNRKDAQVALKEVNDSLFKDRYIRVQFSTSQGYTFNKFKGSEKKRCDFRNDDAFKIKNFNSNFSSQDSAFDQLNPLSFSRQYNHNNNSAQYPPGFLPHYKNESSSSAYRPITNSKSVNSCLCLPKSKESSWEASYKISQQNKERNKQYQQFELQQRQNLMNLLYLRQLENQQKLILQQQKDQMQASFSRSNTMDNLTSNGFHMFNANNMQTPSMSPADMNGINQVFNTAPTTSLLRSNTMFSFKHN